jgi:hypothetical protein
MPTNSTAQSDARDEAARAAGRGRYAPVIRDVMRS